METRVFGRCEDPAHLPETLFRVHEVGEGRDAGVRVPAEPVFRNPVESGQPRVEDTFAHVARHLLRPNQHALDLGIVDGGEVRPRADVDVEAGTREQLHRRVLQRSFWNPESELHGIVTPSARRKKQVRSPVWQTLPSPSRSAFTSTVSSSQSISTSRTASLFPEVSPFVHSLLRVRL